MNSKQHEAITKLATESMVHVEYKVMAGDKKVRIGMEGRTGTMDEQGEIIWDPFPIICNHCKYTFTPKET